MSNQQQAQAQPGQQFNLSNITTAFELPNQPIKKNIGLVRGITVRSRSAIGNMAAGIQSIFGGNITIYTELCEHARQEAYEIMIQHAMQMGANAIVAVRYDTTEIMQGITEVICYGTGVVI